MESQKENIFSPRIFLILAVFTYNFSAPAQSLDSLRHRITTELAKHPGTFAVAFKDLNTGQELMIRERESFHAASTMKTPVLIEVYKQAAQGKFLLTDSMVVKNTFRSIVDGSPFSLSLGDDSEEKLYAQLGARQPISALVHAMITRSSNLATNLLIELVDAKNVLQTMRDLGASDIQVRRGVEDTKAFRQGLNNTTTAYDLLLIFEKLAKGKVVSPEASRAMVGVLLDQHFKSLIPAKLPKTVKVAHKTGSITGVQHDSGIVFLPDGRKYVLVLLSKDLKDEKAATEAMAMVSGWIYDASNPVSGRRP